MNDRDYAMQSVETLTLEAEARRARRDVNAFVEFVFGEADGTPLVQQELHRVGHAFIDWCWAHERRALLLWPRYHGKTTQALARLAWEIGRAYSGASPGTARLYTNSGDIGAARTEALKSIIDSERFRRVFPKVRIERSGERGKDSATAFNVRGRVAGELDYSFTAQSIVSSKAGGRATVIGLLDDVVDATSMESGAHREKVLGRWQNDVSNIIVGPTLAIGTRWHRDDLWASLRGSPGWAAMVVSAANAPDGGPLIAEYHGLPADAPAFPREIACPAINDWTAERYVQARAVGRASWARQYCQEPLSGETQKFTEAMFARIDISRIDFGKCRFVTFIDPAGGHDGGDTTALVTLIVGAQSQPGLAVGDAVLWLGEATYTALSRIPDRLQYIEARITERGGAASMWAVQCEINGGWESGWVATRADPRMSGYPLMSGIKHTTAKAGRIEGIEASVSRASGAGRLWIRDDWPQVPALSAAMAQVWDWPHGSNDDFPDALSAAIIEARLGGATAFSESRVPPRVSVIPRPPAIPRRLA